MPTPIAVPLAYLALLLLLGCQATEQTDRYEAQARTAADAWLALIDAGQYDSTWSIASAYFRAAMPQDQWVATLRNVDTQLGTPTEARGFLAARYTNALPNVPEGDYVVSQYRVRRTEATVIETVILMRKDGASWQVAGYFVRPDEGVSLF